MGPVYKLLKNRKHWTKGKLARNKYGHHAELGTKSAVRFCLYGACINCYPDPAQLIKACSKLSDVLILKGLSPSYVEFNDNSTHAKVLELVKEAGI